MYRSKLSLRMMSPLWCLSVGISLCVWLWTCAVVMYVMSAPHKWAISRYAQSLLQPTQIAIPLSTPPPGSASVVSLRVHIGESLLIEQDEPSSSVRQAPILSATSPVKLVGSLMVQVTAIDDAGCVVATASTRYQASGEALIELPLRLIPTDVQKCSPSLDSAASATTFANRN